MFQAKPTPAKLHPLTALGGVLALVGISLWVWTGDWAWAVQGILVLLAMTVVGTVLTQLKRPD